MQQIPSYLSVQGIPCQTYLLFKPLEYPSPYLTSRFRYFDAKFEFHKKYRLCKRFFSAQYVARTYQSWKVQIKSNIRFVLLQNCGLEMDKENGKATEASSGPSKVSGVQDSAAILDAASLFGGK